MGKIQTNMSSTNMANVVKSSESAPHMALGEEVEILLAMSFAMFVGAFVFGSLPLCIQKSVDPNKMRLVTILGAGILIGTALIVIIPEGMHMWVSAMKTEEAEAEAASHEHEHAHEHHVHGHHHGHSDWILGASLASGFAFMLVVDKLGAGYGHDGHAHNSGLTDGAGDKSARNTSAMLGLMVHAAIDGVALGASTYSGAGNVSMLIFVAIMLHKAPASFGLTTFLTSTGLNKREVQKQLLFFSLAAPLGAIVTFYTMHLGLFSYKVKQLAIVMLFSGGTFLFVATAHILPEVMHGGTPLTWKEVWVIVFGTLFPVMINFEHGHGH